MVLMVLYVIVRVNPYITHIEPMTMSKCIAYKTMIENHHKYRARNHVDCVEVNSDIPYKYK